MLAKMEVHVYEVKCFNSLAKKLIEGHFSIQKTRTRPMNNPNPQAPNYS